MPDLLMQILNPVARWSHMVGATLLLGGTLFHTVVVPRALENVKEEQQLAILGQMRWIFRKVVWIGAVALALSGTLCLHRLWRSYAMLDPANTPWVLLHVAVGLLGILVAMRVTVFGRIPDRWLGWMRLNVGLLLVGIFFANMARHVRLELQDRQYDQIVQWAKEGHVPPQVTIRNVRPPAE